MSTTPALGGSGQDQQGDMSKKIRSKKGRNQKPDECGDHVIKSSWRLAHRWHAHVQNGPFTLKGFSTEVTAPTESPYPDNCSVQVIIVVPLKMGNQQEGRKVALVTLALATYSAIAAATRSVGSKIAAMSNALRTSVVL